MKILVSNVGSTSLKFKLFDMPAEQLLCEARIESVGSVSDARFYYHNVISDNKMQKDNLSIPDYTCGISMFLSTLTEQSLGAVNDLSSIAGVGFKTVLAKGYHGVFELDENVLRAMEEYMYIAPAHNGPYLQAIDVFRGLLPGIPLIGVFETAFHKTIPMANRLYAIPYEWYEKYGIMRLGYHGASHGYIARTVEQRFGSTGRLISCHLGGSCSICAIKDGKSIDNSFGFSPQAGVMHANRVGDCDPFIMPFLLNKGMPLDEIVTGFGKKGGLLGISGVSNDLRKVEQAAQNGNSRAELAIDVLVHDIVRYIGAYFAELGGLDHLVFTGGIGENSSSLRERVCLSLACLGIHLDPQRNASPKGICCISKDEADVGVFVIPANEEIGIVRETYKMISNAQ